MKKPVKKLTGLARQAQEAMRLAVRGVIKEHRKTGQPLAVILHGRFHYLEQAMAQLFPLRLQLLQAAAGVVTQQLGGDGVQARRGVAQLPAPGQLKALFQFVQSFSVEQRNPISTQQFGPPLEPFFFAQGFFKPLTAALQRAVDRFW